MKEKSYYMFPCFLCRCQPDKGSNLNSEKRHIPRGQEMF